MFYLLKLDDKKNQPQRHNDKEFFIHNLLFKQALQFLLTMTEHNFKRNLRDQRSCCVGNTARVSKDAGRIIFHNIQKVMWAIIL
jgi:hypothetical protein